MIFRKIYFNLAAKTVRMSTRKRGNDNDDTSYSVPEDSNGKFEFGPTRVEMSERTNERTNKRERKIDR